MTWWLEDGRNSDSKKMFPARFADNGWLHPILEGGRPVSAEMKVVVVRSDAKTWTLGVIKKLVDGQSVDVTEYVRSKNATSAEETYRAPDPSEALVRVARERILLVTESSFRKVPVQIELKKETVEGIRKLLQQENVPQPPLIRNEHVDEETAEEIRERLVELLPDVNPNLLQLDLPSHNVLFNIS